MLKWHCVRTQLGGPQVLVVVQVCYYLVGRTSLVVLSWADKFVSTELGGRQVLVVVQGPPLQGHQQGRYAHDLGALPQAGMLPAFSLYTDMI